MGAERNALTVAAVYKAILQGKTPVVSLGGGVFCNPKSFELFLGESIKKIFGHAVNFVTVLMNGTSGGGSNVESIPFSQLEDSKFFETEYARLTRESLTDIIAARVARSDPLYPKKEGPDAEARLTSMLAASSKNMNFARAIASVSNIVFTVRHVPADNYDFLTRMDLSEIRSALRPVPPGITNGKFDQIRAVFLVDLSSFGDRFKKSGSHVTLFFRGGDNETTVTPLAKLDGLDIAVRGRCDDNGVMLADVYTMWFKPKEWDDSNPNFVSKHKSVCKKVVVTVLSGAIGDRDGLHLTEDSGPFSADKMRNVSEWINVGKRDKLIMADRTGVEYFLDDIGEYKVSVRMNAKATKDAEFTIPAAITVQAVPYYYKGIAAFVRGDSN
jgi:hypothetical protein